MNKEQYLKELKRELRRRGVKNVKDIVQEYSQHFDEGNKKGLKEEEIVEELGTINDIVDSYMPQEKLISRNKKFQKLFLSFAIIFTVVFCGFFTSTFVNLYSNEMFEQLYFIEKDTKYFPATQVVEVHIANAGSRKFKQLEICLDSKNLLTGASYKTNYKTVDIDGGVVLEFNLPIQFFNNHEIKVMVKQNDGTDLKLWGADKYNARKTLINVVISFTVVGFAGMATFYTLYILKRKQII